MGSHNVGKQLLACLSRDSEGAKKFLRFELTEDLFYGSEVDLFERCSKHMQSYGTIPSLDLLGLTETATPEPAEYYADQVAARYRHRATRALLEGAAEHMRGDQANPDKALEALQEGLLDLVMRRHRGKVIDVSREAHRILQREYLLKQKLGTEYGIQLGWPYLDEMLSGGLQPGDVLSIVGRPAAGKTYNTLWMANNAWNVQKRPVMFVTMEIKPTPLLQRIAAMYTHKSITELRSAKMGTKAKNAMFAQLDALKDTHPPYYVVDGNLAATPQDIAVLARQLRPAAVYVDGAYLLRHVNWRMSKWERIGSNLEFLKEIVAGEMAIPVVCSYQFNRDAAKKKQKSVGLEDIAGADVIGQISSTVLGLFEDDTVESLTSKKIEVLKGRNGEVGEFRVNWKFDEWPFMDFSEIEKEEDGELDYL